MTVSRLKYGAMAVLVATFLVSGMARSQALPAASKTSAITAFGGFTYAEPDFGPFKDKGGTFGAAYTRYFHIPVSPSFELRSSYISGATIVEKTYTAGLGLQYDHLGRYHPFANFDAGLGQIVYPTPPVYTEPNYLKDQSLVYNYGAGINIDVYRNFQARAEFEYQTWDLGVNVALVPGGSHFTLTPNLFTLGVTYRIPFRFYKRQSDFYR